MVHDRERLAFLLEARQHGARIHPRLDDLERHPLHVRLATLHEVDDSESALSEHREQAVGTDRLARQGAAVT
jgi:hypothetical protein